MNTTLRTAIEKAKKDSFNGQQATKTKVQNLLIKADNSNEDNFQKKCRAQDLMYQANKDGYISVFSSDIYNGKESVVFYAYEVVINSEVEQKRIYKIFN